MESNMIGGHRRERVSRTMWFALLSLGLAAAVPVHAQAPISAADTVAPRSADELMRRFRVAHDKRDGDAVGRLFFWGKSSPSMRRNMVESARSDFTLKISGISIQPLKAYYLVTAAPVAR